MKNLQEFINEVTYNQWGYTHKVNVKYFPETKEELQKIIERKCIAKTRKSAKDPEYLHLTDIDVSKIKDMSNLFEFYDFNKILYIYAYNWDVSNVTNMEEMFKGLSRVRFIELKNWDVSNVTNMKKMFYAMGDFNAYFDKWQLKSIKDTTQMFSHCESLTGDFTHWDNFKPDNYKDMFYNCKRIEENELPKWYNGRLKYDDPFKDSPDLFWHGPRGPYVNVNPRNNRYN